MTFNFLGPGLTVNVEAKVKEQIILDSSDFIDKNKAAQRGAAEEQKILCWSGIKAAVEQVLDTEGCADGPSRSSP